MDKKLRQQEQNLIQQRMEDQKNFENEMKQQEAELKNHLKDLNNRQLNEYKDRLQREKDADKQAGMMMAGKAAQDEQAHRQLELQKRQAYLDSLNSEVAQRNKIRELDSLMQKQEQDNARRVMAENAQKEIERERQYKDRFLRFDENQKAKHQWYQANIMDPNKMKT